METYICTIAAALKGGARIDYRAEVRAGTEEDAAEKCKLRARLDLKALDPEFSLYVDVKKLGGKTSSYRVD